MYSSFIPKPKLLAGTAAAGVPERILAALSRSYITHYNPQFRTLITEIIQMLKVAFKTEHKYTFPILGSGRYGMECCLANLIEPHDKVIICINGQYGILMALMAARLDAKVMTLESEWGELVNPIALEQLLSDNPDTKIVAFVHAESTTGVYSDAKAIAKVAKSYGCLTVMDAVASFVGMTVEIDDWQIDAVYANSQKCLACPSGLAIVSFSDEAYRKIINRSRQNTHYCLDVIPIFDMLDKHIDRTFHYSAPTTLLYALHEALIIILEYGLDEVVAVHKTVNDCLREALEQAGLKLFKSLRHAQYIPYLTCYQIPANVTDEHYFREQLSAKTYLEINTSFGKLEHKLWRIGLMGRLNCTHENAILAANEIIKQLQSF
jgi:alanine-glyoxylate transaminase/serine-glyoxylate transaminase/serine-pyruvate transaminase